MEKISVSGIEGELIDRLLIELGKSIVGQREVVFKTLAAMLVGGHVLLEGAPGLAKTTLVKSLAQAVSCKFARVQFTPDLMPSDLTGAMVFNPKTNDFHIRKGPIFANFVLADEINRAPAKVQSALLEAMQEQQVTIADTSYPLPDPFWVLATQNPIEQEGTYRLPEAQADRFLFKLSIDFPILEEEVIIARNAISGKQQISSQVIGLAELKILKDAVRSVFIDEKIEKYAAEITASTRKANINKITRFIRYGASPRGTIALLLAARAVAFLKGRAYVIPEDIQFIAKDSLRHRIGLTFEALAENISADEIVSEIFGIVKAP